MAFSTLIYCVSVLTSINFAFSVGVVQAIKSERKIVKIVMCLITVSSENVFAFLKCRDKIYGDQEKGGYSQRPNTRVYLPSPIIQENCNINRKLNLFLPV
jgi:hypothetical protein